MTLATSLRTAARNLIDKFGNSASLYTYSGATTTESDEGDISVSDWKTATAIIVVDGLNMKDQLVNAMQGIENIGDDEKVVRDDVAVAVNDRLTIDSEEYRVDSIKPVRIQSTDVVQIITIKKVTDVTAW